MKAWAKFLLHNEQEALGSDGTLPLDGRHNLDSHIQTARHQLKRLSKIHPSWCEFKIMKGEFARGNDMIHLEIKCE